MFKGPAPGYTIVETMIFLAVSGAILLAAILLFQGQQGKTQFDQSMRDLTSRIQQYVDDVSSGFFPGSNTYGCSAASGRPQLNSTPNGLGANSPCIFLGKAIGISGNNLKVYTVLGDRLDPVSQQPVTSISGANPEPMTQAGFDITQTYGILWGATVYSSQIIDTSNNPGVNSNLVGFYNNLQGTSTSGSENLTGYAYAITDITNSAFLKTCVEATGLSSGGCSNYLLKTWNLCMQSTTSNRRALITANASSAGVTTKLQIGGC